MGYSKTPIFSFPRSYFIELKDRIREKNMHKQSERQRERRIFYQLFNYTNGYNVWCRERAKANSGTWNSTQVFKSSGRRPDLWTIFHCSRTYISRDWIKVEQQTLAPVPVEGNDVIAGDFTSWTTTLYHLMNLAVRARKCQVQLIKPFFSLNKHSGQI